MMKCLDNFLNNVPGHNSPLNYLIIPWGYNTYAKRTLARPVGNNLRKGL